MSDDIRANGDTAVNAEFEIHCTTDPAHFWKYWIDADTQSNAVLFQRQLYFEVVDVETMQKLDWLPASNDLRHKLFAIFFPEVKPGDRKTLRLSYFWPGFMKKLTALGATNFDWRYRSQNPEKRAHCRKEWIFHADMPVIRCRATGRHSKTALLKFMEQGDARFGCMKTPAPSWIAQHTQSSFLSRNVGDGEDAEKV